MPTTSTDHDYLRVCTLGHDSPDGFEVAGKPETLQKLRFMMYQFKKRARGRSGKPGDDDFWREARRVMEAVVLTLIERPDGMVLRIARQVDGGPGQILADALAAHDKRQAEASSRRVAQQVGNVPRLPSSGLVRPGGAGYFSREG